MVVHISSRQFTWLTVNVLISTSVLVMPGTILAAARQNAWLAVLAATLLAIAGTALNLALARRFPGQTVAQYAQTLLGSWMGKLVGLFYSLTCMFLVAMCISVVSRVIKLTLMQETPLWPIVIGFVLLTVYSAWLGIESVARANDLILPFILLILLSLFLLASPEGKLYRALPVLQLNFPRIVRGFLPAFACLGEVFFVLLLAPAINKPGELRAAALKGVFWSGLIVMFVTQAVLFVLGAFRSSVYLFPLVNVSEELNILDVFERFEPFLLTALFIANSIKMSVLTYCSVSAAAESITGLKNRTILLLTMVMIPVIALTPVSIAELLEIWVGLFAFNVLIPIAFIVLPALLLLVAKVRNYA